jgi:TPR repeat protein
MRAYDEGDSALGLYLMEECAKKGDPVACYMAALWHRDASNLEKSAEWMSKLESLAEQGNPEAQWELGQQYRFGDLRPLNIELANHWLQRAADSGWGEAQHHMAWYYETGQYEFPVDHAAAETWYRRAFEQQHPETVYLFAIRKFHAGQPTEEAIALLSKAADLGFSEAAEVLKTYRH